MSFKTILVLLNDTARTPQLLDASSVLARQFDAHLIGLYVLPAAKVYSDVGMLAVPAVFEGYRKLFKSRLEDVRRKFDARLNQDGLRGEWRVGDSNYPDIAESAIFHARAAELVIASQIDYGKDGQIERDLVARLILESGRPVLIIPKHGKFAPEGEGIAERAIVGINGTRESARAMFDALPLLKLVKETCLLWVDPDREIGLAGDVPGAEEAVALSRHRIKAVAEPMVTDGQNAGEALLKRANDLGADLLVMGAYAHSRTREFVFGGATRYVLEHAGIPVLMSH
jgi:nucleotide-binding universal stress UspA family protein